MIERVRNSITSVWFLPCTLFSLQSYRHHYGWSVDLISVKFLPEWLQIEITRNCIILMENSHTTLVIKLNQLNSVNMNHDPWTEHQACTMHIAHSLLSADFFFCSQNLLIFLDIIAYVREFAIFSINVYEHNKFQLMLSNCTSETLKILHTLQKKAFTPDVSWLNHQLCRSNTWKKSCTHWNFIVKFLRQN